MQTMNPILIVQPDERAEYAFMDEVMKAEGLFHFERRPVDSCDVEMLRGAPLLIALPGKYSSEEAERLTRRIADGGRAIVIFPSGALADRLEIRRHVVRSTQTRGPSVDWDGGCPIALDVMEPVEDAWVHVLPGSGLTGAPEPLFCPGWTSESFDADGATLAVLRDQNGKERGPAIVRQRVGKGTAILLAYDLVRAVLHLRHGTWDLDQKPEMLPLRGPRHINGFVGIAERYSRRVPLADVHQDIFRELVLATIDYPVVPRLWHFPDAQRVAVFIKSDGCGEEGAEVGIELAERYGHLHNFFRPPQSAYGGAIIRKWHERGHHMSMEGDIYPVTYNRKVAELGEAQHVELRRIIQAQAQRFESETGLPLGTFVIHGCQWTGAGTARVLIDHGWRMPFHFCSHDPRMNPKTFGPYSVASAMPMRYFDSEAGLLDLFLQPCTIDDSQSITEPSVGTMAMGQVEYATRTMGFVFEAEERWHVPHIGTYHPCYLIRPHGDPRRTFEAANMFYAAMAARGIRLGNLGEWYGFIDARDQIKFEQVKIGPEGCEVELLAPKAIRGLTVIAEGDGEVSRGYVNERDTPLHSMEIEGRRRAALVVSLGRGERCRIAFVQ